LKGNKKKKKKKSCLSHVNKGSHTFFALQFEALNAIQGAHCGMLLNGRPNILMQKKKNYENSNISPCKNIMFQKSSKRNQNPSKYYNSIV
jgi:hypothetical protein